MNGALMWLDCIVSVRPDGFETRVALPLQPYGEKNTIGRCVARYYPRDNGVFSIVELYQDGMHYSEPGSDRHTALRLARLLRKDTIRVGPPPGKLVKRMVKVGNRYVETGETEIAE